MSERDQARATSLGEPMLAYAAAIAVAATLYWSSRWSGLIQQVGQGLIACMFLLGPRAASWLSGHDFDERAAGIGYRPVGKGLRVLGFALLVTWPVFIAAFLVYYGIGCTGTGLLHRLALLTTPLCPRWHGLPGLRLRLPDQFLIAALSQILVVAVPEEVFFRGYLMSRFEARWPSRSRLWGARVGWPLVLSSVLFALGHFLVDLQPARLAVFLPALAFGWMRSRSGSVAPGAVFHALCNLLSALMHESAF